MDPEREEMPEILLCPFARDERGRPINSNATCMHRRDAFMSFQFSQQVGGRERVLALLMCEREGREWVWCVCVCVSKGERERGRERE